MNKLDQESEKIRKWQAGWASNPQSGFWRPVVYQLTDPPMLRSNDIRNYRRRQRFCH